MSFIPVKLPDSGLLEIEISSEFKKHKHHSYFIYHLIFQNQKKESLQYIKKRPRFFSYVCLSNMMGIAYRASILEESNICGMK